MTEYPNLKNGEKIGANVYYVGTNCNDRDSFFRDLEEKKLKVLSMTVDPGDRLYFYIVVDFDI